MKAKRDVNGTCWSEKLLYLAGIINLDNKKLVILSTNLLSELVIYNADAI